MEERYKNMNNKIVIHLAEKYPDPLVEIDSLPISSKDKQKYVLYTSNDKPHTLKVTCDGYDDYLLEEVNTGVINVTLHKNSGIDLKTIVMGVVGVVSVVVSTLVIVDELLADVQDREDKADPVHVKARRNSRRLIKNIQSNGAEDFFDYRYKSSRKKPSILDRILRFFDGDKEDSDDYRLDYITEY